MNETDTQPTAGADAAGQGSRLDAEVDGRSLRFWIGIGLAIAVVVLAVGAWWVWGLGRGMPMDGGMGTMDGGMADMPTTGVRFPPVQGFYEGEEVFFAHSEASDPQVAGMLTEMMASPVLVVPELAETPEQARDDVYVFTNGVEGMGPLGFQPDVFPSAPGDDAYRPLRHVVLVTWVDEDRARELRSADEILAAAEAGEVELEDSGAVVNMPMLTWPGGGR
jgi:hypothetical protein